MRIIAVFIYFLISSDLAIAKICRKGTPCGNTCIAKWKTCQVGRGSAIHESALIVQNSDRSYSSAEESITQDTPLSNSTDLKNATYKFRSYGSGYFIAESLSGKILKCTSYCIGMSTLNRGKKIEFLDNFKIVEFETYSPHSCEVTKCIEIHK